MLAQFLVLMGFQLAGEVIVTSLGLVFPGPLCGLLLLLGWLHLRGWTVGGSGSVGRD
jgi:putative effector of murein hydrolase LrgA (UPF0299 family)